MIKAVFKSQSCVLVVWFSSHTLYLFQFIEYSLRRIISCRWGPRYIVYSGNMGAIAPIRTANDALF